MINIFDLDYTLMDTTKFKKDLASVFDMSVDKWDKSYYKHFKSKGVNYSIDKHLDILKEEGFIKSEGEIKNKFNELLKEIDDYLFPGAKEVLEKLKERGDELVLATFGDMGWQKLKVDSLKIKNLFDKVILEDKRKDKNQLINELKNKETTSFNDNADELDRMKKLLGEKARGYLVKGPYSKNIKHDMEIHESIGSLLPFLERDRETVRETRGLR